MELCFTHIEVRLLSVPLLCERSLCDINTKGSFWHTKLVSHIICNVTFYLILHCIIVSPEGKFSRNSLKNFPYTLDFVLHGTRGKSLSNLSLLCSPFTENRLEVAF